MLAPREVAVGRSQYDPGLAPAEPVPEADLSRWDRLFSEHSPAVYRLCLSRLRNPQDAEDATQETFARAIGLGGNVGEGWLITVARNVCIDHLRRQARSAVVVLDEDSELEDRGPGPDVEVVGEATVLDLLDQLTVSERRVVAATVLDDRSHAEAAESLGIATSTGRVLLSRATKKMRSYLREHPEMLGAQVVLALPDLMRRLRGFAGSADGLNVAGIAGAGLPGVMAVFVAISVPVQPIPTDSGTLGTNISSIGDPGSSTPAAASPEGAPVGDPALASGAEDLDAAPATTPQQAPVVPDASRTLPFLFRPPGGKPGPVRSLLSGLGSGAAPLLTPPNPGVSPGGAPGTDQPRNGGRIRSILGQLLP